jgi:hypothetical protein
MVDQIENSQSESPSVTAVLNKVKSFVNIKNLNNSFKLLL